jgi:hypothetical protein
MFRRGGPGTALIGIARDCGRFAKRPYKNRPTHRGDMKANSSIRWWVEAKRFLNFADALTAGVIQV